MSAKDFIRSAMIFMHLDLTRNLRYDRLSRQIFRKVIGRDSNCIDIGCHKGEMLRMICRLAPHGEHFAFEPIPDLYLQLKEDFMGVTVLPFALGNMNGESAFQFVRNAPAYSGIKKRRYAVENPDITELQVELRRLDEVIPADKRIDFIKIDVEGAEFEVLKGARRILNTYHPVIIFEFGLGASDYYGSDPLALYDYLCVECGFKIFTMHAFLRGDKALGKQDFSRIYTNNEEYYFVGSV